MSKTALYLLALVNLLGFAFMIVMNVMANALPINGKTTGELSDVYPNLFVPAGLTFSIWGVIYILLTLFVIYQGVVVIKMSTGGAGFLENIHIWFSLSCLFNGGWILAWHHQKVGLSLLIMLGLLACLLIIYLRLGIGKGTVPGATRYLVHVPFSIYLGWISIATIANITAWLVHTGWNGWGISQATWTVVVLAATVVLAYLMLFTRHDTFFALVVAWALFGIWLKRSGAPDPVPVVTWTALSGLILVVLGIVADLLPFRSVTGKG
ncbi:MAG TPA: hypothetical protein ENF21_06945 [Bacteroidetes bacterium]|nr:hypothetical protein [Bacteroidota bacterium]